MGIPACLMVLLAIIPVTVTRALLPITTAAGTMAMGITDTGTAITKGTAITEDTALTEDMLAITAAPGITIKTTTSNSSKAGEFPPARRSFYARL